MGGMKQVVLGFIWDVGWDHVGRIEGLRRGERERERKRERERERGREGERGMRGSEREREGGGAGWWPL